MTPKRLIFDAHHHLWALDTLRYPWLTAKGVKRFFGDPTPIQKDYLASAFIADAASFDLVGSTHIQVGVADEDAVAETAWLQKTAESGAGLPSAIVGFADLTRDDLAMMLDAHCQHRRFRGVRQIIGRHPVEDQATKSGDLLDHPDFVRGLRMLESWGLRFDLQLVEAQY
ncbi:MAG: amidohydrolase, partial [Pseudomonadota bacterium]